MNSYFFMIILLTLKLPRKHKLFDCCGVGGFCGRGGFCGCGRGCGRGGGGCGRGCDCGGRDCGGGHGCGGCGGDCGG